MPNGANFGQNRKNHTFCSKTAFWAQNHFLGPKSVLGAKSYFLAKSAILSKKCVLELSRTHIQVIFFAIWPPWCPQKAILAPKITFWLQNRLFAIFAFLEPKMHSGRKFAFLRPHVADVYKTNGILMKMEPFLAQTRFWAQKCVLGSKIGFWAQNAKKSQELHFWAQKCFLRKSDQKVNDGLSV